MCKYEIPSFIYKKSTKAIIKNRRKSKEYNFSMDRKNLVGIDNPNIHGKALKGNFRNYWRYRIGDYRIITEINHDEIKIIVIGIGHRKDIYENF